MRLAFLILEFPRILAELFRISRGESLFSKDKVKNLKIPRGFFRQVFILSTHPVFGIFLEQLNTDERQGVPHMHVCNQPIHCKKFKAQSKLPRSGFDTQLDLAICTLQCHYLSLLNGKRYLGGSGGIKECPNYPLQILFNLATAPHCHTRIPSDRRHYLLPPRTC